MTYKVFRGELVGMEGDYLFVTIHKLQDGKFSLSDKIINLLKRGKTALVSFDKLKTKMTVNKKTPILFRETVKSKFVNSKDWWRGWYGVRIEDNAQGEMFV